MSAISLNSRRNLWLNHHQHPAIKKQKSLIENTTIPNLSTTLSVVNETHNNNTNNNNNYPLNLNNNKNCSLSLSSSIRSSKFTILKKQLSLDQVYTTTVPLSSAGISNFTNNNQQKRDSKIINNSTNNNCKDNYIQSDNFINKKRINLKATNWKSIDLVQSFDNSFKSLQNTAISSASILTTTTTTSTTTTTQGLASTSPSLSNFNKLRKPTILQKGNYDNIKTEHDKFKEPAKSSTIDRDRVNLNIFIGNSLSKTDNDCDSDDIENNLSDCIENSLVKENTNSSLAADNPNHLQKQQSTSIEKNSTTIQQTQITIATSVPNSSNPITTSSTSNAQINNISIVPTSITVQRRPPLIRTMSAPPRSLNTNDNNNNSNTKAILTNKRKPRRRKFLGRSSTINDKSSPTDEDNSINLINHHTSTTFKRTNENLNNHNKDSHKDNIINKSNNNSRKTISKVKNTIGCDIVTLVSLISSEGSDSEKEEITNQISTITDITAQTTKRAPFLRKTGKSVSFQNDDIPLLKNSTKESNHFIRRGSIAPLSARLRSNRPPTAPPIPYLLREAENSNLKMDEFSNNNQNIPSQVFTNHVNSDNEHYCESSSSSPIDTTKTSSPSKILSSSSSLLVKTEYPEYVRTQKERECWGLFMKMTMKGISVTYDTILRGMLTPTELRLIQKHQKQSIEIMNQIKIDDDNDLKLIKNQDEVTKTNNMKIIPPKTS